MTHLHMDHASAISEFTAATYVLGEGEWRRSTRPRLALNGYVRQHVAHAVDYREVPYDTPGDRLVLDLRALVRPVRRRLGAAGATRRATRTGTSRVILRLKDREALVAGDAIYFLRTLEDERRGWAMADEHKWRRSLGEIQLYRRENPDALIIPGHDPEAWAELAPRYE